MLCSFSTVAMFLFLGERSRMAMATLLLVLLLALLLPLKADEVFDVRKHLSTVTRYDFANVATADNYVASTIPDGCTTIHINLVARHGTRAPTKKRIRELDNMASRLEVLLRDAKVEAQKGNASLQKIPSWLWGWQSPWKGRQRGGELITIGENEMYHLAVRIRERFPDLFDEEYHPNTFVVKATQVPRASASAVAFGIGLFEGKGSLGTGKHCAFSVISESRASDILLRFHDCCESYKAYRKSQEPAVDKLKEATMDEITSALVSRYELNFTRQDTASLWFLCKQEASLLDITDQACSLFSPFEMYVPQEKWHISTWMAVKTREKVASAVFLMTARIPDAEFSHQISLLEWTDDLELFILKGYGKSINYHMGVPLLQDVVQAMEQAIKSNEENLVPGTYEKARLRFAHAETVVPFSCLIGLFLEGSEFEQILREQPLELPPKPPQPRNWKGSIVAPFAGNNMLVLHSCPDNNSRKYFVQGCDNKDFCPFDDFKERIVNPHLKHDYDSLCSKKSEGQEPKPVTSKLTQLYRWLFWQDGNTRKDKVEL
ncbi:multiple inositol polyphosphate phosphatase 1-like isoform X2 [Macadamia integrifolia]|uniref:multiple inositol polyphosphate phosphatase 1-like isoform X2 n=1 Tax=Macadamia integrifolia TaxID=60698 RepID=UPI001C534281|nr:multiple inositol polyphosphate phosphatase 1-like isoform X2 [Macadamia integrifolia]